VSRRSQGRQAARGKRRADATATGQRVGEWDDRGRRFTRPVQCRGGTSCPWMTGMRVLVWNWMPPRLAYAQNNGRAVVVAHTTVQYNLLLLHAHEYVWNEWIQKRSKNIKRIRCRNWKLKTHTHYPLFSILQNDALS
jgi:hypothetical protein